MLATGATELPWYIKVPSWIVSLVVAFFYMRAFQKLSENSVENKFNIAGIMLFVGSLLTILTTYAGILTGLAWIVAALAFSALKPKEKQAFQSQINQQPLNLTTTSYTNTCYNCGAKINPQITYYPNCGKQVKPNREAMSYSQVPEKNNFRSFFRLFANFVQLFDGQT
jgi:hypothetical protein